MTYLVYMLRCADGSLYTGSTNNLKKRLRKHEAGKGAKYTRGRGPFEVVYIRHCPSRSEALRHEAAIKKLSPAEKRVLVEEEGNVDEHAQKPR